MKLILVIALFSAFNLYGATPIKGEGKFTSVAGDTHEFIKRQLIFEGIKDIISTELENLKLNKEAFWKKYDESLAEKLSEIEVNYKELKKYDVEANLNRKKLIEENIRKKQLRYRRKFLGLNKLLSKFSIRKISRSQKNPRYRYIKLEGAINSKRLTKTYYNLVRGKQTSAYGSLYLRPKFNFKGVSYVDLGVENEKDFETEVTKNWMEWFIENKPVNIANIELLEGSKEEKFNQLMKLPITDFKANMPESFVNSLILEIEVNLKKEKYDDKLKEFTFEYSGYAFLKDIQTNLTIGTYQFGVKKYGNISKIYRKSNKVSLVNLMARDVFQLAKGSFPRINKGIKNMPPISDVKHVSLLDFENINQVHSFLNLAQTRGVKFSLKTKLDSFSSNNASAVFFYDGEFSEVKTFLQQLQSAKKDLSFEVIDEGDQFGIKFNKVIENI